MNRLNTINMALREYGEATSPAHFGGTTVVIGWYNDVKREFELETRCVYGTVGTTATASSRTYAVATALFHPVYLRHKGKYLTKTTREALGGEESGSTWVADKGNPASWYRAEGLNRIGLYPMPTGGQGGSVIVEGYKTTPDISTDTGVPTWPHFHRALVDGLLRRFAEEDSDNGRNTAAWARANARYVKYVSLASRETDKASGAKPHPDWR